MKRPHKAKPRRQQDLARERIAILLGQAAARFSEEPELSNRYVRLARRIAMLRWLAVFLLLLPRFFAGP